MEFFLCFLIAVVITGGRSASDIIHALKGTEPPHLAKTRLRAQPPARPDGQPHTATLGDLFRAYWGAAMSDAIAHRARVQRDKDARRRANADSRPVPAEHRRRTLAGWAKNLGRLIWEPVGEPRREQTPAPTVVPDPQQPTANPAGPDGNGIPQPRQPDRSDPPGPQRPAPDQDIDVPLDEPAPPPDTSNDTDSPTAGGVPNLEGETVNQHINTATSGPTSEVTGYRSAVAYAKAVAAAHQAHGGAESYIGSLSTMEFGPDIVASAQAAMEASRNAAEMWQQHADAMVSSNAAVNEAYMTSPSAANKQANLNE